MPECARKRRVSVESRHHGRARKAPHEPGGADAMFEELPTPSNTPKRWPGCRRTTPIRPPDAGSPRVESLPAGDDDYGFSRILQQDEAGGL
jgi:hypothetical protein